jgi:hypothetical protein
MDGNFIIVSGQELSHLSTSVLKGTVLTSVCIVRGEKGKSAGQ